MTEIEKALYESAIKDLIGARNNLISANGLIRNEEYQKKINAICKEIVLLQLEIKRDFTDMTDEEYNKSKEFVEMYL